MKYSARLSEKQARSLVAELEKDKLAKYGLTHKELLNKYGKLNFNFLMSDRKGKKYILSIPRDNPALIKIVSSQYRSIGLFNHGGGFQLRSIKEMVTLYQKCEKVGVLVPKIIEYGDLFIFREFAEGRLYQDVLSQSSGSADLIISYLTQLANLHRHKIVLGDRWGPNEIVTADNKIIFIDFDTKLIKIGKEMEVAQAIYYSIQFSCRRMEAARAIEQLLPTLSQNKYRWKYVKEILVGHLDYFKSHTTSYGVKYNDINRYLKMIFGGMR